MMCRVTTSELIGGGYNRFWNCKARYRVLKGGKGSKKSSVTALNLIYRLMRYKNSNLLVVRAVMNTHRDSTFAQLKWAQQKLKVSHLWQNNLAPMEMTYTPTGQKILFRGFDDVLKLASTTVEKGSINFVWIEEAFEIGSLSDFEKLDLSVPRGAVEKGLFKQTTITFNPWSREHWLKKRFFDKNDSNVETFTTNYLCNEFLDDTDRQVFLRMKEQNARKYAVAGLGEWGVAEGAVYENWEIGELADLRGYKPYFGLDYGYMNDPSAFIAFYANSEKKHIYIFDEFKKTGMLNSEIADEIKKRGYAKERIRADCAEPKSNEDLRRNGIYRVMPSVKGRDSILNGIAAVNEYKITVAPHCKASIAELSAYVYSNRLNDRGQRLPVDRDNHLMDALRYAFCDVKQVKSATTEKVKGKEVLLKKWY